MSKAEDKALTLAYNYVTYLGWTHTMLSGRYGISMPTLRRIRDGREIKSCTREFCLKAFVEIANEAYHRDLQQRGGVHSDDFKNFFTRTLLTLLGIPD